MCLLGPGVYGYVHVFCTRTARNISNMASPHYVYLTDAETYTGTGTGKHYPHIGTAEERAARDCGAEGEEDAAFVGISLLAFLFFPLRFLAVLRFNVL